MTKDAVAVARARDGLELRVYRWLAVGEPRAHLLLVHGIAEHAGRYANVGARFASAGITTHSFDLRGFGASGGHRAYVDRWSRFHDDLEDRLTEIRASGGGLPVVLYGHSMGGLVALGYVLSDAPRPLPDLLVLSAPAIDATVPPWKRMVADILGVAAPRFAIANTFPPGALSSDPAVEAAYLADPLAVHRTTARLGFELFGEQTRVQRVLKRGRPLPVSTYVVHGADDPLVPERVSRSLDGRTNVTRRVYPGLRHETHNEPTGGAVVDDTAAWILRKIADLPRGGPTGARPLSRSVAPRAAAHFRRSEHRELYESFFLKAIDPRGQRAVWIRYTVRKHAGQQLTGALWVTLFDAGADGPQVAKETFAGDTLSDEAYVGIGASRLAPGRAQGQIDAGTPARWDLAFDTGEAALRHLPEALYGAALPKTKLESLHPSTRFNGTVTVGERRVDVHDWPGTIGHNWGTQHAERWVWLHAAGFDGHALDTWIDAAIARVRVGPLVLPWVANGALAIDGVRYRLGGIGRVHQTRITESVKGCELSLRGPDIALEGRVTADPARSVGWAYADPGGGSHHVLHNSLAEMTLRVTRPSKVGSGMELHTRAATYELGLRPTDHGVTIQPYEDD